MKKYCWLKYLLILIVGLAIIQPLTVWAADTDGPDIKIPELQINLPGLLFSDQNKIQTSSDGENISFYIPWIGEYLSWLYNYSVGMIAVLALLAIMIGGFNWLLAGGNASRVTEAKNWISAAIGGLSLALGSYLILVTLNSNLVRLSSIKMMVMKKIDIDIPAPINGSESYTGTEACTDPCVPQSSLVSISTSMTGLSCAANQCLVDTDTFQKLKTAGEKAYLMGYKLVVSDAFRNCAKQQELWIKYGQNPRRVARPSCSSAHLRGKAVDIYITKGNVSYKMTYNTYPKGGPYNLRDTKEIKLLKQIMIEAGFIRYCGEWWHFQTSMPIVPCYDPVR